MLLCTPHCITPDYLSRGHAISPYRVRSTLPPHTPHTPHPLPQGIGPSTFPSPPPPPTAGEWQGPQHTFEILHLPLSGEDNLTGRGCGLPPARSRRRQPSCPWVPLGASVEHQPVRAEVRQALVLRVSSIKQPVLRGLVDLNCNVVTFANEVTWWRNKGVHPPHPDGARGRSRTEV